MHEFNHSFLVAKQESECIDAAFLQSLKVTLQPAHPAALRRACSSWVLLISAPVMET